MAGKRSKKASPKAPAFRRKNLTIAGVKTVVLTAGQGEPLVFLHGAGTFTGFDFALEWARQFRVYVPYHPGFGESADDPKIDSISDYVMHYADLFDALGLDQAYVVGHSLGGWIGAEFATVFGHRVKKLVLVSPAGLRVEGAKGDFFTIPPMELPSYLSEKPELILRHVKQTVDFAVDRYRETTSAARVFWSRTYDPKLPRWLHRITMPTLVVWGTRDRMLPYSLAEKWTAAIPDAELATLRGVGHFVMEEKPAVLNRIARFLKA